MHLLSDQVTRKFTDVVEINEWSIMTDSGWQSLEDIKQTVEYEVYLLELVNGMFLECADTHIVYTETMEEVFVKDLVTGQLIMTDSGPIAVKSVMNKQYSETMYDVGVDSTDHRFYTNQILSHNTTTAAGYLLWYAMFIPDSTILIAAHKYAGAQEIMLRIRYAYENCPMYIKAGAVTYNKGSLEFDNGSRIVSATTTENTGRGMSISLLYCDEFSFLRPSIAEAFWTAISPTLATGGKAIITSTPNSDEDQFALLWKGANKCEDEFGNPTIVGKNGFKAYRADWRRHPDRDEKWAEDMRAQLGEDRFRREMDLEFLIDAETLIKPAILIELEGKEPIERMGQIRWYEKPKKGNIYVVGLDPSLGTGGDCAAIEIFEANSTTQIGEWKHNKTPIPEQIKLLAEITNYIAEITQEPDNIYYSIENNSIGEAALLSLNEYGEHNIKGFFTSERGKKRKGFNTTNKTKLTACSKLKSLVETKRMKINSRNLVSELKSFIASGGSYAAKSGDNDDLVMATLLVIRVIQHVSDYHAELGEQIRDHDELILPMPFFAVFG